MFSGTIRRIGFRSTLGTWKLTIFTDGKTRSFSDTSALGKVGWKRRKEQI
jgi:hypothetical protein